MAYVQLYDDDSFVGSLNDAFLYIDEECNKRANCSDCPYLFNTSESTGNGHEDRDCIGSLIGESWRRMRNKIGD